MGRKWVDMDGPVFLQKGGAFHIFSDSVQGGYRGNHHVAQKGSGTA